MVVINRKTLAYLSDLREGQTGQDPGDNDHRQSAQALQASSRIKKASLAMAKAFNPPTFTGPGTEDLRHFLLGHLQAPPPWC